MRASIALEQALREGDVDAARRALGDPAGWPNVVDPYTHTPVLSLAIGRSPLEAIRRLLAEGADPNFQPVNDGFPTLIDVIHHRRDDRPELTKWSDAHEVLAAMIAAGAKVDERGLNDWTALHFAASYDDEVAVGMLLAAGADPHARTRIDDLESPLDTAENGSPRALAVLRAWLADKSHDDPRRRPRPQP